MPLYGKAIKTIFFARFSMLVSILINVIVSHLKMRNDHPVPFLLCCALLRKWVLGLTMNMCSYLIGWGNMFQVAVEAGCFWRLADKFELTPYGDIHLFLMWIRRWLDLLRLMIYFFYCHWKIPCCIFIKSKERLFSKTSNSLQNFLVSMLEIQGSKRCWKMVHQWWWGE